MLVSFLTLPKKCLEFDPNPYGPRAQSLFWVRVRVRVKVRDRGLK
jgi:hypothetical protein